MASQESAVTEVAVAVRGTFSVCCSCGGHEGALDPASMRTGWVRGGGGERGGYLPFEDDPNNTIRPTL